LAQVPSIADRGHEHDHRNLAQFGGGRRLAGQIHRPRRHGLLGQLVLDARGDAPGLAVMRRVEEGKLNLQALTPS
jgi:hypothetical protein